MGLCAVCSPAERPVGVGHSRPPWAPAGRTKEPCKYVFPCTTLKQHTSPFHGEIILVKREESLYNGCGAVLLLCGRSCLLHRGVGRCELSTSCPYYSPCLYCTAICDGAQAVFSDFSSPRPLFCCSEGVHCVSAALVARHGRGRGAYRRLGARRGQRCVPLHAIPRRGAGGNLRRPPVGIASL